MATDDLKNWNYNDSHVEQSVGGNEYIGAHSVLVAAGPPELKKISSASGSSSSGGDPSDVDASNNDIVYPIGVIQNLRMNQNRQVQRLFEIGSERSYMIPGRLVGQLNMGRVMYHGKSLLRVLQATRHDPSLANSSSGGITQKSNDPGDVESLPGSDANFWINMASSFFDKPIGLMFYLKDNQDRDYGQFYVENAYINTHSLQLGAGSTIITENATMQFDRAKPVELTNTGDEGNNPS